jgi:hypothetical protein
MSPQAKTPGMGAVEGGEDVVVGEDVAVFVEVELPLKHLGVGDVADAEEHEGDGEDGLSPDLLRGAEALTSFSSTPRTSSTTVLERNSMLGWAMARSSMMREARKFSRAVDEGDFGGEAGEEERLFHGGVAAADDGDLLAGEEEAVAGGAGADAVADEGLLGGQVEPAGAGAEAMMRVRVWMVSLPS